MVVVARVARSLAGIAEVALRDDAKCPDRRERAAVFAVELVGAIVVVEHNLALEPARQVEAFHERVSWIPIAVPVTIAVPLAPAIFGVPRVVVPPPVVDSVVVPRVVVTVTWIEAVVDHTLLPSWKTGRTLTNRCEALVQRMCAWDRCGGWRVDWDAPS